MRKKILVGLLIFIALIALFWISGHSRLELVLPDQAGLTAQLTDASNHTKNSQLRGTVSRIVGRGQYRLTVKNSNASYVEVINTAGFLRKTSVTAKLTVENDRTFVGDNPAACMYYMRQILLSSVCQDIYSQLTMHVPATSTVPTYVRKVGGVIDGSVEAFLTQKSLLVLRASNGTGHLRYTIGNNFSLNDGHLLTELSRDKTYTFQAYKDGWVAYDDAFSEVWKYDNSLSHATKVIINHPKNSSFRPVALGTSTNSLMVAYGNGAGQTKPSGYDTASTEPTTKKTKTIIVDGSSEYSFNMSVSSFTPCGNQKLCLLSGSTLSVYNLASGKPKLLFKMNDVQQIMGSQPLLVVTKDGVQSLDADKQAGFTSYSFGEYNYCGIKPADGGYLLCVRNFKGRSSALYVNQSSSNTDSIDKKMLDLLKKDGVKDAIIYGSSIFVSPDLGQPVLGVHGYEYPDSVKAAGSQKINQAAKDLQINTTKFRVVVTIH